MTTNTITTKDIQEITKMFKFFAEDSKKDKSSYTREQAAEFKLIYESFLNGNYNLYKLQIKSFIEDLILGAEVGAVESLNRYKRFNSFF